MGHKKKHIIGRIDSQNLDFAYLSGCGADEWPDIARAIHDSAVTITRNLPVPAETQQALDLMICRSVDSFLYDMSTAKKHGGTAKLNVMDALCDAAFQALMFAHSDDEDFRLSIADRALVSRMACELARKKAQVLFKQGPAAIDQEIQAALELVRTVSERLGLPVGQMDAQEASDAILAEIERADDEAEKARSEAERQARKAEAAEKRIQELEAEADDLRLKLEAETAAKKDAERAYDGIKREEARIIDEAERARGKAEAMLKETALAAIAQPKADLDDELRAALIRGELATPTSAQAIPALSGLVFGSDVVFSPKALDDIEGFKGRVEELWAAVCALAGCYLQGARAGRAPDPVSFREMTGFKMSPNESETTMANPKMRNERTSTIDGIEVTTMAHLKGQSSFGDNALRVYFAYVPERNAIGIVRCTGHLTTMGTRKRGF